MTDYQMCMGVYAAGGGCRPIIVIIIIIIKSIESIIIIIKSPGCQPSLINNPNQ